MRLLATGAFLTALVSATPTEHLDVYDYIVVGSGPGGGPLACVENRPLSVTPVS